MNTAGRYTGAAVAIKPRTEGQSAALETNRHGSALAQTSKSVDEARRGEEPPWSVQLQADVEKGGGIVARGANNLTQFRARS
jgi:hypothetical protein